MIMLSRALAALVAILGACYFVVTAYFLPDWLKEAVPQAEQLAAEYINGSVTLEQLEWNGRLTVSAKGIRLYDVNRQLVASLPRVDASLNPLKAIGGAAHALTELTLTRPEFWLNEKVAADGSGSWNVETLLKPSDSDETPFYGLLVIRGGAAHIDMRSGKYDVGVDGTLDGSGNPDFALDINARDLAAADNVVKVQGVVDKKLKGHLAAQAYHFDISHYSGTAEYYSEQRLRKAAGALSRVDVKWENDGRNVMLSGGGTLENLGATFIYDGEEYQAALNGSIDFSDSEFHTDGLTLALNGQQAQLTGHVDFKDLQNLVGEAELSADKLTAFGYEISQAHVPVIFGDHRITVAGANARLGGGILRAEGGYGLEDQSVTGFVEAERVALNLPQQIGNAEITGSFGVRGSLTEENKRLNFLADTANILWQDENFRVLDFDAEMNLSDETFALNNFSVRGESGAALASGTGTLDGTFELRGRISEFPITAALKLAGEEGSGKISGEFSAYGTADNPCFDGMVQLLDARVRKFEIKEAHGLIRLQDGLITLRDYAVQMSQGKHLIDGTIDLRGDEPAFDLSAETTNVRAEPFAELAAGMAGSELPLTGNLTNFVQLQGTPSKLAVTGEGHLTDGSYDGYLIDEISGSYAFKDGALTLNDGVLRALSTTLRLSGHMDKEHNLDFVAEGANIDLERLPIKDETAKLAGFVSLKGTLTGTLEQPLFEGSAESESFTVNGETIKKLHGTVTANGKESNSLVGYCEQDADDGMLFSGLYAVNLDINLVEKYMKGDVNISYGSVRSLLKMAGLDYNVTGSLTGALRFMPYGRNSGVVLDASIEDLKLNNVGPYRAQALAHFNQGTLSFDSVRIDEAPDAYRASTDGGYIILGGNVDLQKKLYNLEAGAVNVNPAIVTALMADPVELKGTLNGLLQLGGAFENPDGNASIELSEGSAAGVSFDKGVAMLSLKDDNVRLEQLLFTRDEYKVSAYGDVPVDLFRDKQNRRNQAAQMNVQLDLSSAGLGVLNAFSMIDWGLGDIEGVVTATGTLEEPLLNGNLKLKDGVIKIHGVETLVDKINLDMDFEGDTIKVNSLSTVLDKGSLTGSGSYRLRSGAEEEYAISLKAANASIKSAMLSGCVNGTLNIRPQKYFDRPSGEQKKNLPPQLKFRPLIQADVKLDDMLINMPTVPEMGEGGSNIGLDMKVTLGDRIHLYNKYLYDLWLGGGVYVKGSTVFPVIEGRIEARRGTVTYLSRTQFKIESAFVNWVDPGSFLPNVNVKATTKFDRYRINLAVTGPVMEMDLKLTSEPQLTQDKIMRMLMLQRVSTTGDDITGSDLSNLAAAGLQTLLLGDMEYMIKQALGIDEFRLYMGQLNAGVELDRLSGTRELTDEERNQYNVLVAKDLFGDRWRVGYTSSFNGDHYKIYTQYNINDHLNFNVSSDEDSDKKYILEYRITF